VVALAQLGFANAVATLGTACTSDHVQKLFRFTDAVVFSFDGDAAGRRAARKALDAALPFASDTRSIKFLFLPDEHDPDSFIRQFGREAFARHVEQAVPLSRFLIEAASQDCEMASAEGRARMASQARGLWTALPDGALKRQLLAEIADTVQIDSRELLQVWQPGRSQGPPREGRRQSAAPTPSLSAGPVQAARASRPPHRLPGRIQPASREDRVLRMLLTEPGLWDRIGDAEHAVLCALPAPHGPLFAWLEAQIHEHGVQPWAALREGLRGHPQEAYALQQLAQIPAGIEPTWDETQPVLGELLKRARQLEMDDLAQRAATDPQAMARYRELAAQGR
jgi:DNA primase